MRWSAALIRGGVPILFLAGSVIATCAAQEPAGAPSLPAIAPAKAVAGLFVARYWPQPWIKYWPFQ